MLPDWEEKRHLEVEKNYSSHEYSFLFIIAWPSTRNSTSQLPPTPPQSMTYWCQWSRACLEHWVETTAAGSKSRRETEPQDTEDDERSPNNLCDQTKRQFPSSPLPWQSGEWLIDGGQATASRHPRSFRALQDHQQKVLVLPSGELFPAQALSVSGQWVECEGAICTAKHISMWHVLVQDVQNCVLRIYSLPLT